MRKQLSEDFVPIKKKVRRIPVHLQERFEKELNKLIDQKTHYKI